MFRMLEPERTGSPTHPSAVPLASTESTRSSLVTEHLTEVYLHLADRGGSPLPLRPADTRLGWAHGGRDCVSAKRPVAVWTHARAPDASAWRSDRITEADQARFRIDCPVEALKSIQGPDLTHRYLAKAPREERVSIRVSWLSNIPRPMQTRGKRRRLNRRAACVLGGPGPGDGDAPTCPALWKKKKHAMSGGYPVKMAIRDVDRHRLAILSRRARAEFEIVILGFDTSETTVLEEPHSPRIRDARTRQERIVRRHPSKMAEKGTSNPGIPPWSVQ
ncbi:unnamed protein product [Diplocarpon coronariae]